MKRRALVLAAHGSNQALAVNAMIRRYAEQIAVLREFNEVAVAFHQGEPAFAEVLDLLAADVVTVVPVMTSAGYYSEQVLPRELAKNRRFADVRLTITRPVGTHPEMARLVARRAEELLAEHGLRADETAVALVGHGTERHRKSREATEDLARALQARGIAREVVAVFLDEAPNVGAVFELTKARNILALPFLIGAGYHAERDVPARLGLTEVAPTAGEVGGRFVVADRPIGADPRLPEIIAAVAREARDGNGEVQGDVRQKRPACPRVLRLGTRGSRLALWQAEHVAARLRAQGAQVEIVEITTAGDRDQASAIAELPVAAFADDIEAALAAGAIDLAVHSLKDMALDAPAELVVAAILPRGDVSESLVSHNDVCLSDLPAGARVGTSSWRRAAQLLAVRGDLCVETIRGAVDGRVQQVRDGAFDAAIMATAGLERLGLLDAACERLPIETFLPAPGQAALAVQVRADDEAVRALCDTLNDAATRRATQAELAFLRAFDRCDDLAAAAYATGEDELTLRARLLSRDGRRQADVTVTARDPQSAATEAIERVAAFAESVRAGALVEGVR